MNPTILTYILLLVSLGTIAFNVLTYMKNKKNGETTVLKPFQLIAAAIVLVLALIAIATGQTYEDILRYF